VGSTLYKMIFIISTNKHYLHRCYQLWFYKYEKWAICAEAKWLMHVAASLSDEDTTVMLSGEWYINYVCLCCMSFIFCWPAIFHTYDTLAV
jgi:hypothetical protein